MNRILWNRRPRDARDGGDIDEVVLHDVHTVHIEQMNGQCWWIGIYIDRDHYWMGNFTADSRGRMTFSEQENALSDDWEHDGTHEVTS